MTINVFWFRRDLRLDDNAGLYQALKQPESLLPIFIFDTVILNQLEEKADRRVAFIHAALVQVQEELVKKGASLLVLHNTPLEAFKHILANYTVGQVFTNHDYEPYATERDNTIRQYLQSQGVAFHTFKDQVIFEKNEIIKGNGDPYTVYTPYSKRWQASYTDFYGRSYPCHRYTGNFLSQPAQPIPRLEDIGFRSLDLSFPARQPDRDILQLYAEQRDFPAIRGTSRISVHLRFGTISIRRLVRQALALSPVYLRELVWREFYQMILWHFPQVGKGRAFKPEYEHIRWRNNEKEFEKWCAGLTGYPIVDAGMRELNSTGFMYNRVRMIVASFLAKHLLIDWRWGEAYFAGKLLDYDLAANNGGWQWAAGSGCDAAPYFRIFNPALQTKRFDPELKYIRQWVPELDSFDYPAPIVDHEEARKRCLEVYAKAVKKGV